MLALFRTDCLLHIGAVPGIINAEFKTARIRTAPDGTNPQGSVKSNMKK